MLTESLTPSAGKVAVRILADDILPNHRGLEALSEETITGWRATVWSIVWLLPPVAFVGFVAWARRERRFQLDTGLKRRRSALRRGLSNLEECHAAEDVRERARGCSRALREFVGDKLGVEGSALTPLEAEQLLQEAGAAGPLARRTREVLDRLEAAQYASRTVPSSPPPKIDELMRELEKTLDGGAAR